MSVSWEKFSRFVRWVLTPEQLGEDSASTKAQSPRPWQWLMLPETLPKEVGPVPGAAASAANLLQPELLPRVTDNAVAQRRGLLTWVLQRESLPQDDALKSQPRSSVLGWVLKPESLAEKSCTCGVTTQLRPAESLSAADSDLRVSASSRPGFLAWLLRGERLPEDPVAHTSATHFNGAGGRKAKGLLNG